MKPRLRNIGPGALVTAAFVGPGTVTTCTIAGANFGYALLWSLVFATLATMVLQEMSARLGTVTQKGLGENLRQLLQHKVWRWPMIVLIVLAIYIGNAAYEAGNIAGAALGVATLLGEHYHSHTVVLIALLAAALLYFGHYRVIESVLLALVATMAIAFVTVFFITKPDFAALVKGLVVQIPEGSLSTVIALIGTTVVPYNLFLHASAAKSRWQGMKDLATARTDTVLTIGLGGLITLFIVSTAAAGLFGSGIVVAGVADMAVQLEPLFGSSAKFFLALGLFAAGLSSAITAPLATAYVVSEIFGMRTPGIFKTAALSVIFIGGTLALTEIKPITIIVSAQFANGLLLPVIAAFLLYTLNQKRLLGMHCNGWVSNFLGLGVVAITAGLGMRMAAASLGFHLP